MDSCETCRWSSVRQFEGPGGFINHYLYCDRFGIYPGKNRGACKEFKQK